MDGTLFGVGVGPGDPELMTLKAARLIRECGVIAVPDSGAEQNAAYQIAASVVPEIEKKRLLKLNLPMTRDPNVLESSQQRAAEEIAAFLRQGENVAFLTLGDPSVFSTYGYLHARVAAMGFKAQMAPGVPSFCAAAALLGKSLTDAGSALHIIPAPYEGVREALKAKGTKVLMKSGKSFPRVKQMLMEEGYGGKIEVVERCGMEGERVYRSLEETGDELSYFSMLVIKE